MNTPFVRKDQNLIRGIVINLVLALIAFFLAYGTIAISTGLHFIGIGIGLILSILCFTYFGYGGLRKITVGFLAAPLLFGKRVWNQVLDEGWTWYWPSPIGDINQNDVRKRSLDIAMTEVLAKDKVPVRIDFSAEIEVTDIARYLGVVNPDQLFDKAANGSVRLIAAKIQSENIADARISILDILQNGTKQGEMPKGLDHLIQNREDKVELEELELIGLTEHALSEWGIRIITTRLGSVRLPEEIEKARANIKVEEAQTLAETVQARNVDNLAKIYQGDGSDKLSRAEGMRLAMTDRGKAELIHIEGTASDLVKAGALAGRKPKS